METKAEAHSRTVTPAAARAGQERGAEGGMATNLEAGGFGARRRTAEPAAAGHAQHPPRQLRPAAGGARRTGPDRRSRTRAHPDAPRARARRPETAA
ncbi:hypothetical protein GCM10022630_30720 [Thermobifida alba]